MIVQYAIVTFPTLGLAERVESIRHRFDPLAPVLSAHVTLVFPFAGAEIAPRLGEHVSEAVAGVSAFDITLGRPTIADAGYFLLHVANGADRFVHLHARLYSGLLAAYLSPTHHYQPHITVGRLSTIDELATAAEEAQMALAGPLSGRVDELAVVRSDRPSQCTVQFTIPLA